jgi:hypothetical protein
MTDCSAVTARQVKPLRKFRERMRGNLYRYAAYPGKTQQAGKGFSILPSRDQPDRGLAETPVRKPSFWNVRLDTNFWEMLGG